MSSFNPDVTITPIYGNIKEPQYDLTWFKTFHIVLNALDNLGRSTLRERSSAYLIWFSRTSDARRHVNRMCMAARIPLIESGTAGYLGQVQPLMKASSQLSSGHWRYF